MSDGPQKPGNASIEREAACLDSVPDVRDGLTRLERAILLELEQVQHELKGRNVPSTLLYGRVAERVNVSPGEFQRVLTRLVSRTQRTHLRR